MKRRLLKVCWRQNYYILQLKEIKEQVKRKITLKFKSVSNLELHPESN